MMGSDKNLQRGLMGSPRCCGCKEQSRCTVVYDGHHNEYFSLTCGKVIMEMGVFVVPYREWCGKG